MDSSWIQPVLTFVGVIIGSGLIQFLITRKDNKKNKIDELCEKIDKGLIEQQVEFKQGLDEREATGKERYLEHREAIQKLNEAIFQLTKNDTEQHQYMKYIGEELMGLAHDRLVSLTDAYQIRGAITLKEKATLEAIFKPYHEGLGGNGDGEQGYKYAMALPVVTDAKAREMDEKLKAGMPVR